MKNSAQKRTNSAGMTAQNDMFPDMPHVLPAIPFPDTAVRKRVIIERPAPPPIRRVCASCGASFDDYTRRPNTAYCRPSCKNRMTEIKRDTAVQTFAETTGISLDDSWMVYDTEGGLKALETRLAALGYTFSRDRKAWVK